MIPGAPELQDPFDGLRFGYHVQDGDYVIYSLGPDRMDNSDDVYYSSAMRAPWLRRAWATSPALGAS